MVENKFFPEIHGNFGFGCMRLPMKGDKVDYEHFQRMADAFVDAGFNYFDTAHGYISGQSETSIGDCVSARIPRERFLLTNKLSDSYFHSEADIRPFFEDQLRRCQEDYFDFYLMHAQNKNNYEQYKRYRAYETGSRLKEEGLIRHLGLSFHDKAEVLDMILTEHPEVEIVQIQFNYLDYEDEKVESRKVYEVCVKHGKPVIVMEPVKGGSLVNLPPEADAKLKKLGGGSNASYALRFAASEPNMAMVLSGMSDMAQMEDNISSMKDFVPVSDKERTVIGEVCAIMKGKDLIPCTSCRYCIEQNQCPMDIQIPDMFSAMNARAILGDGNTSSYYDTVITSDGHGKASECIGCGGCESVCPQHLEIRSLLQDVAKTFE